MLRNSEAPISQTIGHTKVIWQLRRNALSVFNPELVTCSVLLKFLLLLQGLAIEVSSYLSGLSFVETFLIYDVWNGLVYDDLTFCSKRVCIDCLLIQSWRMKCFVYNVLSAWKIAQKRSLCQCLTQWYTERAQIYFSPIEYSSDNITFSEMTACVWLHL